jgi:hypothetical protein
LPVVRAAFIASNSALVGKSLGPDFFLSLLFAFFAALLDEAFWPFLGARDSGTIVLCFSANGLLALCH